MLAELGHTVDAASNYEQAIKEYSIANPDLVVLDILMEGKDGIDVLNTIKENHPEAKVVLISSLPENELENIAQTTNVDGYLTKPFSKFALEELMENLSL